MGVVAGSGSGSGTGSGSGVGTGWVGTAGRDRGGATAASRSGTVGVGATSGPADFTSLLGDVETKLFDRFPDDTVVHPGHGLPTTLGAERPHLEEWRARGW